MMLKNLIVIAAIMLLGFVPSQIGMLLLEHEGWVGRVFGHHGADLDAVSSKFLIVGGGVWLWLLLDSIWLRWAKDPRGNFCQRNEVGANKPKHSRRCCFRILPGFHGSGAGLHARTGHMKHVLATRGGVPSTGIGRFTGSGPV